jgi:hypothetical protein
VNDLVVMKALIARGPSPARAEPSRPAWGSETKLHLLVALACTVLTISACLYKPYHGGNAPGRHYDIDYYENGYGRPAWRQWALGRLSLAVVWTRPAC